MKYEEMGRTQDDLRSKLQTVSAERDLLKVRRGFRDELVAWIRRFDEAQRGILDNKSTASTDCYAVKTDFLIYVKKSLTADHAAILNSTASLPPFLLIPKQIKDEELQQSWKVLETYKRRVNGLIQTLD